MPVGSCTRSLFFVRRLHKLDPVNRQSYFPSPVGFRFVHTGKMAGVIGSIPTVKLNDGTSIPVVG